MEGRFRIGGGRAIHRPTVALLFIVAAILMLPSTALGVRAVHGKIELPPLTEKTGSQFYRVAEYVLDVGDRVDYSFSASGKVFFSVLVAFLLQQLMGLTFRETEGMLGMVREYYGIDAIPDRSTLCRKLSSNHLAN